MLRLTRVADVKVRYEKTSPMAIKILITGLSLALLVNNAHATEIYNESGGIVVFEVENSKTPYGRWRKKTALPGFTGSGYLELTGNGFDLGEPDSPLLFHFRINKQGTYVFDLDSGSG